MFRGPLTIWFFRIILAKLEQKPGKTENGRLGSENGGLQLTQHCEGTC